MFYVKEETGNTTLRVNITDENIFTVCPRCGKEHHLDFEDFYYALEQDFNCGICCEACSNRENHMNPKKGGRK